MKRKIAFLIVLSLALAFFGAQAAERSFQSENIAFTGEKHEKSAVLVSLRADAENIYIFAFNFDAFRGNKLYFAIKLDGKSIENKREISLKPLGFNKTTFKSPMQRAEEKIEISWSSLGKAQKRLYLRQVQRELSEIWSRGTFNKLYDSLNYHYAKHGKEVFAGNIIAYLENALYFRNEVSADIKALNKKAMGKKYRLTDSRGKTKASKYKSLVDGQFAIFAIDGFLILSYGR